MSSEHQSDPILRKLPVICFSSNIQRFSNQIINQVVSRVNRNQDYLLRLLRNNLGQGNARIIIAETTQEISMSPSISLEIEAININSPSISMENIRFEVVGFSSIEVKVSGDMRVNIRYEDSYHQEHKREQVVPFSTIVAIPGDYPRNAMADGDVALNNLVVSQDIDPSTQAVVGVTVLIFVSAHIRIIVPL